MYMGCMHTYMGVYVFRNGGQGMAIMYPALSFSALFLFVSVFNKRPFLKKINNKRYQVIYTYD